MADRLRSSCCLSGLRLILQPFLTKEPDELGQETRNSCSETTGGSVPSDRPGPLSIVNPDPTTKHPVLLLISDGTGPRWPGQGGREPGLRDPPRMSGLMLIAEDIRSFMKLGQRMVYPGIFLES